MIWTWQELAETDDETLSIKKETFQTHFGSKVDDFDELLFSYIATNGGANRNATKLTREEFITGFDHPAFPTSATLLFDFVEAFHTSS